MATILVVEDNPMNLKLAAVVLVAAGHSVLRAQDGEEGLSIARREKPDLILMDVQMAGMDGLTATRILKSRIETRDIPVVALTAFAMRGDEEKILAAGCDAYVAKPFEQAQLLECVARLLEKGPAKPGSARPPRGQSDG